MALKKEFVCPGGKTGNYCKIIGNHSNTLYQATVARVAIYENQEAREKDEAGYLKVIPVNIPGPDHTRETAYKEIKDYEVKTSTIARGIAVGDELEYADEVTLGRSILNRIPFENNLKNI